VLIGAKTVRHSAECSDKGALMKADSPIGVISASGIVLARLESGASLTLPPMRAKESMRRTGNSMFDLKRKAIAVAIGCFLAAGAFAQKKDERPPKPPNTVVVAPKGERPPPSNHNNQGGDKRNDGGKKGKN